MMRKSFAVVSLFGALAFTGCTEAVDTHTVRDVVKGVPSPQQDVVEGIPAESILVRATVTDVIPGDPLLVELTDNQGEEHIWVSGFSDAPPRATRVFTAITGDPESDDAVGLVYPSAGALPEPETGISKAGAVAVIVVLATVILCGAALIAGLFGRMRSDRPCPSCGAGIASNWLTCPACGKALTELGGKPATMFVSPESQAAMPPAAAEVGDDGPDDEGSPGAAPTRIISS